MTATSTPPSRTTDILGEPYVAETIELGSDNEGPVVATLVSRRADVPTTRAVLYVHGYSDYFFQTHLADWWVAQGYNFYALDLRKYGRSLRPGQTLFYVDDLSEYFEELDAAHRLITSRDGNQTVVVNAHSTGGLVVSLWASEHKPAGLASLVLNSPWLDLMGTWVNREIVTHVLDRVAPLRPRMEIRGALPSVYVESIHRDFHGEWDFDLTLKPLVGPPIYAGWLRAIRRGHAQLHRGLDAGVPVLAMCSAKSFAPKAYDPRCERCDIVVDVRHVAQWAHAITRHHPVSIVRFDGGVHDLVLSREPVRSRVFDTMQHWLEDHVH